MPADYFVIVHFFCLFSPSGNPEIAFPAGETEARWAECSEAFREVRQERTSGFSNAMQMLTGKVPSPSHLSF